MNIWAFLTFWVLWVMLLWIFTYSLCLNIYFHISWVYIPRSRNAGSYGSSMVNLLRNCQTVFQSVKRSHKQLWRFWCLHILANTCYCAFFYFSYSNGCEVVSHCGANIFSTKCPQRISVLFSHSQYDECQPFYGVVSCIADRMEKRVRNIDKVQKKTAKRFGMARVLPWMNNVLNFYTFKNIKWPNHSKQQIILLLFGIFLAWCTSGEENQS